MGKTAKVEKAEKPSKKAKPAPGAWGSITDMCRDRERAPRAPLCAPRRREPPRETRAGARNAQI
jgi:hypothetical protein